MRCGRRRVRQQPPWKATHTQQDNTQSSDEVTSRVHPAARMVGIHAVLKRRRCAATPAEARRPSARAKTDGATPADSVQTQALARPASATAAPGPPKRRHTHPRASAARMHQRIVVGELASTHEHPHMRRCTAPGGHASTHDHARVAAVSGVHARWPAAVQSKCSPRHAFCSAGSTSQGSNTCALHV
jgi:hypothetical protein